MSPSLPPSTGRAPPPVLSKMVCSNATRKSRFLYSTAASIAAAVTSGNLLPSCADYFPSCDLLTTDSGSSSSDICCNSHRSREKELKQLAERREKLYSKQPEDLFADQNATAKWRSEFKQLREDSQGWAKKHGMKNDPVYKSHTREVDATWKSMEKALSLKKK